MKETGIMYSDKEWKYDAGVDHECPYCEELLSFDENSTDIELDFGAVYINWKAHCEKCGRQFRVREIYKHDYSKLFEED